MGDWDSQLKLGDYTEPPHYRSPPKRGPHKKPDAMTAEAFRSWLIIMRMTAAEAGRRLGLHANTVAKYKKRGAPYSISLACRTLFHRLPKGEWE